ncbi:MAG: PKD domain-containing protein [Acidobacteriota bacterium]
MVTLKLRGCSALFRWLMAPALLWGTIAAHGASCRNLYPSAAGEASSHWAMELAQPASNLTLFDRQDSTGNLYFSGFANPGAIGGYDVLLYALSPGGTLEWSKAYGTTADDVGSVGLLTNDGGFLLVGNTYVSFNTSPAPQDSWVCKLDGNGNIQWQDAFFNTASEPLTIQTAYAIPGGYLLVAAYYQSPSAGGFDFIAVSDTGNVLWQQGYGSPTLSYAPPNVRVLSDGSFVAAGSASGSNGTSAIYAVMFSPTGSIEWQETVSGATGGSVWGPLSDGSILLEGSTSLYGGGQGPHPWVLDLDPTNGAILWQKVYAGSGQDYGALVPDPSDSGLLLNGWTTSAGTGNQELWVAQTDLAGNIFSQEVIGGANNTTGTVYPDPAGGYLAQGVSIEPNNQSESSWIVKLSETLSILWQDTLGQSLTAGNLFSFAVPNRLTNGDLLADGFLLSYGQLPTPPAYQSLAWEMDSSGSVGYSCSSVGQGSLVAQQASLKATTTMASVSPGDLATASQPFTVEPGSLAEQPQSLTFQDLCSGGPGSLTASASANVTSGPPPLTVQFSANVTGGTPPYAYAWSFGDQSAPSSEQNPTHVYTQPGTYPVTLEVTDSTGATSTDSHLSIQVTPSSTYSISGTVTLGTLGLQGVTVSTGSTSTITDGSGNYTLTGLVNGSYTVTPTLTGYAFSPSSQSIAINGANVTGVNFVAVTSACSLSCSASGPATALVNTPVSFQATATPSVACSGLTPSYSWSFGDGGTSSQQNPTHTYAAAGTYSWTMTASAPGSTPCSQSGSITVTDAPPPVVTAVTKMGPPFRLVVKGSDLQNGIHVFINGTQWTNTAWKSTNKIVIKGGASLKALVPKNTPVTLTFVNPDGGTATVNGWTW